MNEQIELFNISELEEENKRYYLEKIYFERNKVIITLNELKSLIINLKKEELIFNSEIRHHLIEVIKNLNNLSVLIKKPIQNLKDYETKISLDRLTEHIENLQINFKGLIDVFTTEEGKEAKDKTIYQLNKNYDNYLSNLKKYIKSFREKITLSKENKNNLIMKTLDKQYKYIHNIFFSLEDDKNNNFCNFGLTVSLNAYNELEKIYSKLTEDIKIEYKQLVKLEINLFLKNEINNFVLIVKQFNLELKQTTKILKEKGLTFETISLLESLDVSPENFKLIK